MFPGSLPVGDPVLIVAISVLIFLVVPLVLERFAIPGTIGIILVGAAIGPNGVGILQRDATIVLLGTVGINYLMFVAGLEIDVTAIQSNPWPSLRFGGLSFLLPMLAGTTAAVVLLGFAVPVAVLFAATFASHTLLAYPVIERLDLGSQRTITTAVSGTLVTDTLALLVLTVVAELHTGNPGGWYWAGLLLGMALFVAVAWTLVPRIGTWFFRNVHEESYFEFLFAMAVLFVSAVAAGAVGLEPIIGSFLAGLAMNRLVPSTGPLMDRIQFVGNALFVPFFLLSVGMLVDPAVFAAGGTVWAIGLLGTATVLLTKFLAAWLEGAVTRASRPARLTAYGLTTGQAAATLAIALLAFELGIFDAGIVNGVVLIIVLTGVLSPALTARFGRRLVAALERESEEESDLEGRVLVPVPDSPEEVEGLLDVAMLLRGESSEEPLYALSLARRHGTDATPAVERAEARLQPVEEYGSAANVPVQTLTPIAFNLTDAIRRAVEENRITTLVLPWDRSGGMGRVLFGRTLERILDRTDVRTVVAKTGAPLNAVDRLHVYLPGRVALHLGAMDGLSFVKELAGRLDVPLAVTVVDGDLDRYEPLLASIEPERPFEIDRVPGYRSAAASVREERSANELAVVLTPRPGARGWESGIERLTRSLGSPAESISFVVYLGEAPATGTRRLFRIE
ncbi:MAG: cation:proton antiporter [Halanaeroarchaeum sp.]